MKNLIENVDRNDILSFLREIKTIPKIINMIRTMQSNYQKTKSEDFDIVKMKYKKQLLKKLHNKM